MSGYDNTYILEPILETAENKWNWDFLKRTFAFIKYMDSNMLWPHRSEAQHDKARQLTE